MRKLSKILRFRFDEETVQALQKIPRKSDYVRQAIREKMIKDKHISSIPQFPKDREVIGDTC